MAKPSTHAAVEWDAVYTAHGQQFLNNTPKDNYFTGNPTLDYLKTDAGSYNGGDYLIERYYRPTDRPFRGVHPRDICDLMNDIGKYREEQPEFTPPWIDLAAASYFVTD